MLPRDTGKTRSQRIQIDYYRHRGGLFWWRWACILVALVASGLYVAYVIAGGGTSHASTGAVAAVHASFEDDCQTCHEPMTPIASDAWHWKQDASLAHLEAACQKCHRVGPHHRDALTPQGKKLEQNCASCHREHEGRGHTLVAVGNDQCTQCHRQLDRWHPDSAEPSVRTQVTAFTKAQHGEFASLQQDDPGRIQFDHHQHLLPGQVDPETRGGMTLEMLEPSQRERYRQPGQDDSALVSLDCSSCHLPAGSADYRGDAAADERLGSSMQPVSFDQHCSACHSMNPAGRTDETLPLPHAAPWAEIDLLLEAKLAGMRARGEIRMPRDDSQATPQPGSGTGRAATAEARVSEEEVRAAHQSVREQCLKCHDATSISSDAIAEARSGQAERLIPARWLQRGRYDHAAHRNLDCRYCHQQAFPGEESVPGPATDHQVVMISGIETCTGCHRDAETSPDAAELPREELWVGGPQPTWGSDRCTLCHRYHDTGGVAAEDSGMLVSELVAGPHHSHEPPEDSHEPPVDAVQVAAPERSK